MVETRGSAYFNACSLVASELPKLAPFFSLEKCTRLFRLFYSPPSAENDRGASRLNIARRVVRPKPRAPIDESRVPVTVM